MIELQTVTTKAKNPSTNEFQDVTWGGINVLSTSGTTNYNNLTNKPTINGVTVQGSLTTGDLLITAADVGALPSGTKYGADFALSIDSQTFVVTAQLKDQDGNNLGQAKTIDLPLETMVVSGRYDDTTQKVILTLKNGQTVEFSVADLISGLQSEITLNNKLDADLVDDSASTNKFVTAAEKTTWTGKQDTLTFDGTYDASTNKAATVSTVTDAINDLDVSSVGGSGKYISAISEADGKISATADNIADSPASGGAAPISSGAVYTALASKQDALSQSQLAAANSGITAEKLAADEAALVEVVDSGAKNLLNCSLTEIKSDSFNSGGAYQFTWNGNVCTSTRGVTFTVNSDNSIDVVATSVTADVWLRLKESFQYGVGSYVISGCPSGGSTTTYYIESDNLNARDTGSSIVIERSSAYTDNIFLVVKTGTTFTGTFKPMICTKAAWAGSQKFVPYALSNPTLTPAAIKSVDEGAKNLLQLFQLGSSNANVGNPCTSQGIEYEIQSDGTITAYRKSSASSGAYIFLYKNGAIQNVSEFFDGKHIWSGNPPQYPNGGVSIWYRIGSGSHITLPNGALLPNANGEAVQIGFQISTALSPTQSNPIVFKPMICTAADWNVSKKYVPYRPSWQELTTKEQQNENNILSAYGGMVGKNAAKENDFTATINKTVYCNPITGRIHISAANVSSTDTDSTICRILLYYTDGAASSNNLSLSRGSNISLDVNIGAKIIERIVIYASDNYNDSIGDTVTVSDLMICTQDDYAADPTYQPYARTNTELTVENASQQSEINYAVNTGVKNLCKITTPSARYGSLTFTVNDDGTVTANGDSGSSDKFFYLTTQENGDDPQSYQNCILTGCPSGGSSKTYEILTIGDTVRDYGNGALITSSNPTRIVIAIRKNQTVSNLVFKPMIRPASITDSTFQPYALSNPVITPALIEQVDDGAKNYSPVSSGQITSANGGFPIPSTPITVPIGTYIVSFRFSGNATRGSVQFRSGSTTIDSLSFDMAPLVSVQIEITSDTIDNFNLYSNSTATISDFMICTTADWAVSHKFVPYCPTMQEMYAMILALQNNS